MSALKYRTFYSYLIVSTFPHIFTVILKAQKGMYVTTETKKHKSMQHI